MSTPKTEDMLKGPMSLLEQTLEEQAERITERVKSLPIAGRQIAPRNKTSCASCRRDIGSVGRLLYPGAPTCTKPECETCKASDVTELFETEYGRAIDLYTLRTFLRCFDGPSVFVERTVLVERAPDLGKAYAKLIRWQWAFHAWTLTKRPDGERLGRALLLPPKRIDEIVRVRLKGDWMEVDPSAQLPEPIRSELRQIYGGGPTAEEVPF